LKLPVRLFFAFCGGFLAISSLAFANEELVQVDQKSQPLGFVDKVSAIAIGKPITTVQPKLTQDGYAFGYWTAGAERLSSTNGQSLITATVSVQGSLVLTAHYFPEDQDSDSDNLPDWFEYRNFGNLSKSGTDDPDNDGFTLSQENQLGQATIIPDSIEDGGISFSVSDSINYGDSSNTYKVTVKSDPFGFVTSKTDYFLKDSNLATISLYGANNGYHFAYWSINGARQESPNGTATQQANYLLNEDKIITAHYIPSEQDSDQDGIADWFEMNQFGNLNQNSQSDPDLDGFSNAQESQLGQVSLIKDILEDGGISFSSYQLISYAGRDLVSYKITSQPPGFFDNINDAASKDSLISTPNLNGEKNGYHFAYWSLNGLRQVGASGVAVTQVNLLIEESSELVAHFIPSEQDEDEDGLMDWFELNQFGNLNQGKSDDPDKDDFSNLMEKEFGQEPTIPDMVVDGGISFSSSSSAFYYIQSYDRLEDIDLNNSNTMGLQEIGQYVGTFSTSDPIWNPNQEKPNRYELVTGQGGSDNPRFSISGNQLITNESLIPGTYSIRVRSYNYLKITTEKSFLITADTPPPPPNRAPQIISQDGASIADVKLLENEKFITLVEATDPDEDSLFYYLKDSPDLALFEINKKTGALSFLQTPDFENPNDSDKNNTYEILVVVTDGELEDEQVIRVTIVDVDELVPLSDFVLSPLAFEENLPANRSVGIFSIPEDGTIKDSKNEKFALVGGQGADQNQYFYISGNQLFTNRSFDHESEPVCSIRVSAQADGTFPLEKVFRLRVLDVFENTPPKFTSFEGASNALVQHPENQFFVTLFQGDDPDDQTLSYHLVKEGDFQQFLLSSATGALNFKNNPDYEKPSDLNTDNTYEIAVLVSDGIAVARQSLLIQVQNNVHEDTDKDGLSDAKEAELGTDPEKPDTDGDGFSDGEEVETETDPLDPEDYPGAIKGFDFSVFKLVTHNDDFEDKTSKISFDAVEGKTYYFAVDGVAADRGVNALDFSFNRRSGNTPLSIDSGESSSLSELLSSSEDSNLNEIAWTAPETGMAVLNLKEGTLGATVTVQKLLASGERIEISETTVPAGEQSVYFQTESGQQYIVQFDTLLTLDDLSDDTIVTDPTISFSMNTSRDGAPDNDSFEHRLALRGEETSTLAYLNEASSELREPMHFSLPPPQKSVWWKWTAPADGNLDLQWNAGSRSIALAIYAGWELDDLVRVRGASNSENSHVNIGVKAGVEYAIVLAGYEGDAGEVSLTLDFSATGQYLAPSNDNLADSSLIEKSSIRLSSSNLGATGEPGEPIHGDTSAPTNSIWWKWQAPDSGILRVNTHGSGFDTTLSIYEGQTINELVLNGQNDDHSGSSTSEVEIETQEGKTYAIAVDGFGSQTGQIELNLFFIASDYESPVNDESTHATLISQLGTPVDGTNEFATGKANEPLAENNPGRLSTVWWKWVADRQTPIAATTLGSSIDTILALCQVNGQEVPQLVQQNDDSFGTSSMVWFQPEIGQTYYFCIDGKGDEEGKITLTLRELSASDNLTTEKIQTLLTEESDQALVESAIRLRPLGTERLGETTQYELLNVDTQKTYQVWQWETQPYEQLLGAESSSGAKVQNAYGDTGIQSLYRFKGSFAYELSVTSQKPASLQIDDWLIFDENASLEWWEKRDGDSDSFELLLEYSMDGGLSWRNLNTSPSTSTEGSYFSHKTVSINQLLGRVAKVRLHYRPKHSQIQVGTTASLFVDDIGAFNIYKLTNPVAHTPSNNQVGISLFDPGIQVLFAERIGAPPATRFAQPQVVFPRTDSYLSDFLNSELLSNGWYDSPWYGYYYSPGEMNFWMFTMERGWQFFGGSTLGGGWIYDNEHGWLWTGKAIYPWMYQPSQKGWLYDYSPTTGSRKFVRE